MGRVIQRFQRLKGTNTLTPDLRKAQYRAFSQQLPMMYVTLMMSTWAVAVTHFKLAPIWLTIVLPVLFTIGCAMRLLHWWRSRSIEPTTETATRAMRWTYVLTPVIAVCFTAWSFMLFPYGDAYAQSHLAFYMAITVIACIFCLMHLRLSAMAVAAIVNGGFVIFFAMTGQPTFIAMTLNICLVSAAMLVILNINYRDFHRMVQAQTAARREVEEQRRLLRMIDDMPVAVMTVDADTGRITCANEASKRLIRTIEHLLPFQSESLVGRSIGDCHPYLRQHEAVLSDPGMQPHSARVGLGPEVLDLKISAVTASDGSYLGPMLTWAIVTKQVADENRIHQLAHFDTLTGLANRTTFHEQLDAALAQGERQVALLFIDLDGFKLVNDTKGHRAGDVLLQQVSERLRQVGYGADAIIGRLGGMSFPSCCRMPTQVRWRL